MAATPTELPKPRLIDRLVGPSPREQALDKQVADIEAAFSQFALRHENLEINLAEGNVSMHEALDGISAMLDEKGWHPIWEYDDDGGLTLRQLKSASKQLRELVVGNPFIGNGYRIRNAQTHGGGCEFSSRNRTDGKYKPLPTAARAMFDSPWSQRYIFGNKARSELEKAIFTDGIAFLLGRESDKRMQRVQLHEITAALTDPNNAEEVWAYRREWTPDRQSATDPQKTRVRWYYTDMVPMEDRRTRIQLRGGSQEVAEPGYTMIDMSFNRQVGWTFGVPDALCVVAWARLYKEFLVNGYVMSRSLARLAYKITVQNAQGGNNAAQTIATPGQSGSAYIEGSGNQLTPLATAGRGYDFSSGNGLAAAIAAGLGISLLALTGVSSEGSNASLKTLDPIAKATAAVRRQEWDDEYARIFRWFGMDRKLVVTWHDLPEDTLARLLQAWTLVDTAEVFDGNVMFEELVRVMGIANPGELLKGWKRKSERGGNDSTFGQTGQAPANGRGRQAPDGESPDDHDDDGDGDSSS